MSQITANKNIVDYKQNLPYPQNYNNRFYNNINNNIDNNQNNTINNNVDYINQNNKTGNRPYINNNLQSLNINNTKALIPKVKCTCSKTGCKKKYCACFSNNKFCEGCDCKDCENKPPNEDIKNNFDTNNDNGNVIKQDNIEKINYDKKEISNQKSQRVICNCTKSYCMKKYCECFKQSLNCNSLCRCIECKNKNYNNNCLDYINNTSNSNNFYNYALNNNINNNININNNYSEVHNLLSTFGKSIDYNNPINFQSEAFGIFIKKDKLKIEGRNINLHLVNNNKIMNKVDNDKREKNDNNIIKDLNETPKFSNKKRLRGKNENSGDMKTCPTTNSSKRRRKGVSVVNKNIKKKRLQLN